MLRFLLEKEIKQFARHQFLVRIMIMMPVLLLLILPWAVNLEVKNIRIAVVDLDHGSYSRSLIERLRVSNYFQLKHIADSYDQAMQEIESGRCDMILEIPADFERAIVRGEGSSVFIAVNATNGTKASLGMNYLTEILQIHIKGIANELMQPSWAQEVPQLDLRTQYRFNPLMDYKRFMVPALMVVLLALLCGFLPSLNIVLEKENGTIEQINVSPVSKFSFILAKLIPYWVMGFLVLTLAFGLAWLIYGFTPEGSLLTIYVMALLFVVSMSGFGIVVSNYSETMQQAMFVEFFFLIIFLLMSGLFTPLRSMPPWAQVVAAINPLTYFIEVMRSVFLKGSTLWDMRVQGLILMGFAVLSNIWAVRSYRKQS